MIKKIAMKIILSILLTAVIYSYSIAQCESRLGYDTQGLLCSLDMLKGYPNSEDTTSKCFIIVSLINIDQDKGLLMYGAFDRIIGDADESTKIRLIFYDDTYVTIHHTVYKNKNKVDIFSGSFLEKYDLLLLKTKPIAKIEIIGDDIGEVTYSAGITGVDFMMNIDCLESYL